MIAIKLSFLVAVFAAGALGGAVPLRRGGDAQASRLIGLGNAFAAGIFLGAGLVHMLPDAIEAWQRLGWQYPMAFLLAALAFVFMLLCEHVLLPEAAHRAVHAPSGERFGELDGRARRGFAAYAILAGLSIHSVLEGLAVGAQPELASALVIVAAVMAHKSTEGFALGVSLVRSGMEPRRAWGLLWLFSAATPVGILAGALLDEALQGTAQQAFRATFLSLAAGTFAYVATVDILRDELTEPGGRFAKWLLVAAGTGLMGVLAIWV